MGSQSHGHGPVRACRLPTFSDLGEEHLAWCPDGPSGTTPRSFPLPEGPLTTSLSHVCSLGGPFPQSYTLSRTVFDGRNLFSAESNVVFWNLH